MALKRWKKLKSKRIFHCKWYDVVKDKVELPTKKNIDYFVVKVPPSVFVVPITADKKIIFEKQYRYPVDNFYLELPAGGSEGRKPSLAARKELEEETGYKAKKLKRIGKFVPWNGVSSEVCHVFIASDLVKTKQRLEQTEFIEIYKIPIKKVFQMMEKNKIQCGMTLATLSLARKHLEKYF